MEIIFFHFIPKLKHVFYLQSAVGHEYQSKLSKHCSQTDTSKGFGGKFGVEADRVDQVNHQIFSGQLNASAVRFTFSNMVFSCSLLWALNMLEKPKNMPLRKVDLYIFDKSINIFLKISYFTVHCFM